MRVLLADDPSSMASARLVWRHGFARLPPFPARIGKPTHRTTSSLVSAVFKPALTVFSDDDL